MQKFSEWCRAKTVAEDRIMVEVMAMVDAEGEEDAEPGDAEASIQRINRRAVPPPEGS